MSGLLEVRALELRQPGGAVYLFGVEGKQVHSFAAVDRIRRGESGLSGYQRPEVLRHINSIKDYIDSEAPMIPNAVVLGFDDTVTFASQESVESSLRVGVLRIPLPDGEEGKLPGFIVDGQQRLAAVRDSARESFPVVAVAFIGNPEKQAEQFARVNSVKPLPKAILNALLPHIAGRLSPALESRKLPAMLLERLNHDDSSPLKGKIKTVTNPHGLAADNSFLAALENSLAEGALYELREDTEKALKVLYAWWAAVRDTFPEDWGKKPKESRLFHGAGVAALSFLMDAAVEHIRKEDGFTTPSAEHCAGELQRVAADCHWSEGVWGFGVEWRALQNTPQSQRQLSLYLVTLYKERATAASQEAMAKRRARRIGGVRR
jgi:DGQHR domain-containing protein